MPDFDEDLDELAERAAKEIRDARESGERPVVAHIAHAYGVDR
jgi:hypothetical protein